MTGFLYLLATMTGFSLILDQIFDNEFTETLFFGIVAVFLLFLTVAGFGYIGQMLYT